MPLRGSVDRRLLQSAVHPSSAGQAASPPGAIGPAPRCAGRPPGRVRQQAGEREKEVRYYSLPSGEGAAGSAEHRAWQEQAGEDTAAGLTRREPRNLAAVPSRSKAEGQAPSRFVVRQHAGAAPKRLCILWAQAKYVPCAGMRRIHRSFRERSPRSSECCALTRHRAPRQSGAAYKAAKSTGGSPAWPTFVKKM